MRSDDASTRHPGWLERRQALKLLGIGGAAVAVPALAAACSSSSTSPSGAPGKASTKSISSLTWALPTSTIVGLDIATAFEENTVCVQTVGLEGLLAIANNLSLRPLLATKWSYQPSALKYVFEIRSGVKFWDGTPMTPEDVAFSLTRHIDPKVASQIAGYFDNVSSFDVTGPSEVTIRLKQPDPTVQNSVVFAPILSKAFVEKVGKALGTPGPSVNIMGTGPYRITSFPSSTSATVARNPIFWGARPVVDKCSFTCIPNPQTLMLAMQSGTADGTFNVPVQQAAAWQRMSGVRTYSAPGMFVTYLSFDVTEPPWNDIHVRKAIAYACDRVGYVKAFLGGNGTPASCIVPPQQWAAVRTPAEVSKLYAALPSYPYNLDLARKELAQSAYPHGFTTNNVLAPSNVPAAVKTMESLSTTVKSLGITMPVQEVTSNAWLANIYAHKSLGLMCMLALPDYADPADYPNIAYPTADAIVNGLNTANFSNPEVDSLLQKANATSSDATRAKYLYQVLTISQQQLPYFGLYWENDVMAIQDAYIYENFTGLYYNQNWLTHIFSST
jgi:peptide/nickel transport system substrate-binding protein